MYVCMYVYVYMDACICALLVWWSFDRIVDPQDFDDDAQKQLVVFMVVGNVNSNCNWPSIYHRLLVIGIRNNLC